MNQGRWTFPLAMLSLGFAAATADAAQVFDDGFESEDTCAWSYIGIPDSCPSSRLYAHSGSELYRIDTDALVPSLVGAFNTGGPSITDLAIDKNGRQFAISLAGLWSIDPSSGLATSISAFDGSDSRTSLSFVPINDADPASAERLVTVGASGDAYEVDPATGGLTLLGNFGTSGSDQIRSAGDLVSIRGVGTFAMVTIGDTPSAFDYLASVNTSTWVATPLGSSTGFDRVFGLGYWDGTFYGFVDDGAGAGTGQMITLDSVTGLGTLVQGGAVRWFGAGVATNAPIGE